MEVSPSVIYKSQTTAIQEPPLAAGVEVSSENRSILSPKKLLFFKWASVAKISNSDFATLWNIFEFESENDSTKVPNDNITQEIKQLQVTVEALKATIDDLVVSNKFISMKMFENDTSHKALIEQMREERVFNKEERGKLINIIQSMTIAGGNADEPPRKICKNLTPLPSDMENSIFITQPEKVFHIPISEVKEEVDNTEFLDALGKVTNEEKFAEPKLSENSEMSPKIMKETKSKKLSSKKDKNTSIQLKADKNFFVQRNFPISSIDEMKYINDDYSRTPKYVAVIKKLIERTGISKSLNNIFSDQIIRQFNLDGMKNKGSLKDYPNLLNIIFDALQSDGNDISRDEMEKTLRMAFRKHKNRMCKTDSVRRKKLRLSY